MRSRRAIEQLKVLERKKMSGDRFLELVSFTTFSGRLVMNDEHTRRWKAATTGEPDDAFHIIEHYLTTPPDFPSLDLAELRAAMIETLGLVESPSVDLRDMVPGELKDYVRRPPEQAMLLDVETFALAPTTAVAFEVRLRTDGRVEYTSGIVLPFASCYWMVGAVIGERPPIGARERAVAHQLLESALLEGKAGARFDPYDRRWDGLLPLDQDPLSRLRIVARELRSSLHLDPRLAALQPFTGE